MPRRVALLVPHYTNEAKLFPYNRDISLRITAIRETFEELGILICKNKQQLNDSNLFSNLTNSFDVEFWQKEVNPAPDFIVGNIGIFHIEIDAFFFFGGVSGLQRCIEFPEIMQRIGRCSRSLVIAFMVGMAITNI